MQDPSIRVYPLMHYVHFDISALLHFEHEFNVLHV